MIAIGNLVRLVPIERINQPEIGGARGKVIDVAADGKAAKVGWPRCESWHKATQIMPVDAAARIDAS